MSTLRIACYNFLTGGSKARSTHWRMLRKHVAADIMLTQESRPEPGFTAEHSLYAEAQPGRWGSGVFARARIRPIDVPGFAGWVVGGELDQAAWVSERPLRVFSVHCPAGEQGYVRTMHALLDVLAEPARGADLVLGGDFNVVVGYRGDDERVRMSRAEQLLLDRLTGEFGLLACWQCANPGVPLAQTLRWTGNRRAPYHCDGIFVPQSWRNRLLSCNVVTGRTWRRLSDHNPVVAEFQR